MIINADALTGLEQVADKSVQEVVTSPPYYRLRRYNTPCQWPAISYSPMAGLPAVEVTEWQGELGHESDIFAYIGHLVAIMREVKRVLRDDGTVWFNIGDSYAGAQRIGGSSESKIGSKQETNMGTNFLYGQQAVIPTGLKPKDLMLIPTRLALALQTDGWYLRSQIIWHKPSAMPESVTDRPTEDYEPVYLLAKSERYYYDAQAIAEPSARDWTNAGGSLLNPKTGWQNGAYGDKDRGERRVSDSDGTTRNARAVWTIATEPSAYAHYAMMPSKLAKRCILAGSRVGDTILDPFGGGGTTAKAAYDLGRDYIAIEPNAEYIDEIMKPRLTTTMPLALV